MAFLLTILKPLEWFNDWAGRIGRNLSVTIAIMVIVILLQVFFRYVLNNALPWPDEAARFMMLPLTGLMAPVALRGCMVIQGASCFRASRHFPVHVLNHQQECWLCRAFSRDGRAFDILAAPEPKEHRHHRRLPCMVLKSQKPRCPCCRYLSGSV